MFSHATVLLAFGVGWVYDSISAIVVEDISSAALVHDSGLSVDGYSWSCDKVVSTKDRIGNVSEHDG